MHLPLSQGSVGNRAFGTRHRAALGVEQESDAMVLVVSEETATVSIATVGCWKRDLTLLQMRDVLAGRAPRATAEHAIPLLAG